MNAKTPKKGGVPNSADKSRTGARRSCLGKVARVVGAYNSLLTSHGTHLDAYIADIMKNAQYLETVLRAIKEIGPQGTWLGSRTLSADAPECPWTVEVCRLLAEIGIAAKTGGGASVMEWPHRGCHLAGRSDLAVAVRARFINGEPVNEYVRNGGRVFEMPDLNSRHDVLFFDSLFYVGLWGRMGTMHEVFDLLNRRKLGRLIRSPVYLVERDGYWSKKRDFLTKPLGDNLGPRVSPSDYEGIHIVDLNETSPTQFVRKIIQDILPDLTTN